MNEDDYDIYEFPYEEFENSEAEEPEAFPYDGPQE